ncbi:threonine ammonia-lyase [Lysinibacillus sphaericus]|uniref:threonine ammonia-lyase n=1 Tax=Lysinibacillus sphaericus OT4b.31 TaxID=1285586 RepID=R7ZIT5_LYSSH|nr:threonine/serine dehydratase [Lysinibacillus sphaericus]EON73971.1 pyridoxal-5'-phosphate-dependent protein subunit beta [Lysinibacillus sphaericus OT4b.31]
MLTLEKIQAAQIKIAPYIFETPVVRLYGLDDILGCNVYVKAENMQKTNSFKIRGALHKMLSMPIEQLRQGVVAASSGNHGKGVAYAAKLLNIQATIVLPDTAPIIKVEGIRALGADVVQCKLTERHAITEKLSLEHGYAVIHPYDDYDIMAGQGTLGLEILAQLPHVNTIVVPIGGGGLISGILTAIKSLAPHIKVIGVEPAGVSRYAKSLKAGERLLLEEQKSLADALLPLQPGERNFPIVQKLVDSVVSVDEDFIYKGMKTLLLEGKFMAEPSSSIGIGAALQGILPIAKKDNICFLITGGNVGLNQLQTL